MWKVWDNYQRGLDEKLRPSTARMETSVHLRHLETDSIQGTVDEFNSDDKDSDDDRWPDLESVESD